MLMQKIAFRYGIIMFFGLTGFFLLMHVLHLSENYYLRIFNAAIHLGVLWSALSFWSRNQHWEADEYFNGVVLGMFTSFVGITPFMAFMAIFLEYNPGFLARMKAAMPVGEYLDPFTASLFVAAEGIVISLVASYIFVRILQARRDHAPH